ncbi:phenylacetic acid degradation bifunctional protein PaaZ [Nakamurella sp. A5-74]|uniref:Phenylacetic acid degradation bifunctional protein PaaZ n=1 Tax=Nakamurella sp. A5-74 TaxID=3158264 RepID=A0AAU8DVV1_9ACTN
MITTDTAETALGSFVADSWVIAGGDRTPILDAVTGDVVTSIAAGELDTALMVDHARLVGHRALARMTFHQRALVLKELALHLQSIKDNLYPLSYRTGATHADSWVDVDGGIGVLFAYGSRGRRDMPNDTLYLDGPAEPLSKHGSFVGQHVYSSLPGVAVQINAFNFPVWGMLEKFAPAFLAGVPTIVKPASPTAYLAEATVRAIIASKILPPGTLQLLTGGARGIMDHLDERDLVAFTGSAGTARTLRSDPAVLQRGTRLTSEADSLNCSILAPDAGPDTPEFELYVKALVAEMTSKAGQKCTAIRRALVPQALVAPVIDGVRERIAAKVRIGAPGAEGVTMGALVSRAQRSEVLARIEELRADGAELVVGDPHSFDVLGADPGAGAFLPPMLLHANASARAPHDVEAFGPVSTLMAYDDLDEAIELASRGRGSLVASVITHDPDTARQLVRGLAPWHGRILLLDRDDAKESTGHGSPLPMLVHGGPGRAGGGEEMGGIRGVLHHMQRSALQGSPALLTAVTDRFVVGAPRLDADTEGWEHPFRKPLSRLRIGDTVVGGPRTVTLADIEAFAHSTGDLFYAHMDEDAAAANPFFGGRVAHGYLLLSWAAGLFVQPDPGPVLANTGLEDLRFRTPVKADDSITVTLTAGQITPRETDSYGEVRWNTTITNQRDEIVATYTVLTMVEKD